MKKLAALALVALFSTSVMATGSSHSTDPIVLAVQANLGKTKIEQDLDQVGLFNTGTQYASINNMKVKKGTVLGIQANIGKTTIDQDMNQVGAFNTATQGASINNLEVGCATC